MEKHELRKLASQSEPFSVRQTILLTNPGNVKGVRGYRKCQVAENKEDDNFAHCANVAKIHAVENKK